MSNLPPGMQEGDPHFYPPEHDCICGCPREDHEDDGPCACGNCLVYEPEPEGW
jgi:hypothetical protein